MLQGQREVAQPISGDKEEVETEHEEPRRGSRRAELEGAAASRAEQVPGPRPESQETAEERLLPYNQQIPSLVTRERPPPQ